MSIESWTIVGVVVAALTLFVTYRAYKRDTHRTRKGLVVDQTSWSQVTNEAVRLGGKPLHVSLGEQPVRNFAISRIRVANTGGTPILASDFEREIVVRYDEIDEIYYTALKGRTTRSLSPQISVQGKELVIKPLLLNPGDSFVIEVGVDLRHYGVTPRISAFGRIAGVCDLETRAAPELDASGVPELETTAPNSSHLLTAAGLGLIGGIALAGFLAVFVFGLVKEKEANPFTPLPDTYDTPLPGIYVVPPQ